MTYDQIKTLLAMAAARDNRSPSHAMAIAWHHDLANIDYQLAVEAMSRHYRWPEPIWLTPQHILAHVKVIKAEAKRGTAEPLALPGRFETDHDRSQRISRGVQTCRDVLAAKAKPAAAEDAKPLTPSEVIREAALARARGEARGQRIGYQLKDLYPAVKSTLERA